MEGIIRNNASYYQYRSTEGGHNEKNKCIDDTAEDSANVLEP